MARPLQAGRGPAMASTVALLAVALIPEARAACPASRLVLSFEEGSEPSYVYSPVCGPAGCATNQGTSVGADAVAFYWSLGRGNPAVGAGVDSGALPIDAVLPISPGYPAAVFSDWVDPRVDGCVNYGPPACLALVVADRAPDCDSAEGSCFAFTALSLEDPGVGRPFLFQSADNRIDLEWAPEVASPGLDDQDTATGRVVVNVPRPVTPDLAPACPDALAGYRVWLRDGDGPPLDTAIGGWHAPPSGGSATGGGPIPFGTTTEVVLGCHGSDRVTHWVWIGYTVVFADGFELPWVEVLDDNPDPWGGSTRGRIYCCPDADRDGACGEHLMLEIDCDDDDAAVFPGASQLCGDAKNNDCRHPDWPDLAGTNEVDDDGDGPSECDGDCNDRDATVFEPVVTLDSCDGHDNDCDGRFDQVPAVWTRVGGVRENGHFGISVAGLRDGGFAVGARNESVGAIAGAGAVRLFATPGATAEVLTHPEPAEGDEFGVGLAGIGDVDGDGVGDILVGAYRDDVDGLTDVGSAFVFSGSAAAGHALIHALANPEPDPGDEFGYAAAGLDDVDDDGVPDLVVGARADDGSGSAVVFSGANGEPIRTLRDPDGAAADHFGYAVAAGPDLDDDGVGEILVGAYAADTPFAADAGEVFAFGADGELVEAWADPVGASGEQFGRGLATIADRDGDGLAEILVGAPALPEGLGQALIVSSGSGAVLARLTLPGGAAGDAFGYRLTELDDLDGDGITELAIGVFGHDTATGPNAGVVAVFSGGPLTPFVLDDPSLGTGAAFGFSLARIADADGDGVDDLVVGAWQADRALYTDSFEEAGLVSVIRGASEQDLDGDRTGDVCDPDDDGDGVVDEQDCAPRYAAVSAPPRLVDSVHFGTSKSELRWEPETGAFFRVFKATIAPFPASAPVFACAVAPGQGSSDGRYFDSAVPAPGHLFAYVVQGRNTCGDGPIEPASPGFERVLPEPCP